MNVHLVISRAAVMGSEIDGCKKTRSCMLIPLVSPDLIQSCWMSYRSILGGVNRYASILQVGEIEEIHLKDPTVQSRLNIQG